MKILSSTLLRTADGYQRTGCFNFLCQGFIQVLSSISFGDPLDPINLLMRVKVYREQKSVNRWLSIDREMIGYWPNELFTHLAHDASVVRYGGIAGAVFRSPSDPMGNGNLPSFSIQQSGWMKEMK